MINEINNNKKFFLVVQQSLALVTKGNTLYTTDDKVLCANCGEEGGYVSQLTQVGANGSETITACRIIGTETVSGEVITDLNHESIIQSIETAVDPEKRCNENTDSTDSIATMSPGEKVIFKMLLDLAADVKVLKSHVVSCSSTGSVNNITSVIKTVQLTKLREIGLPLLNKENMGKFNYDLLKEEFKNKVVSILIQIYVYACIYQFIIFHLIY